MKVYKLTDKISLKIDEIEIKFSPLSYQQKQEVLSVMTEAQKQNPIDMNDGIILALKYSLKSVSGLKNEDDTDYQISFDDDGKVNQDSIEVLLNLPMSAKMQSVAGKLLNGVPSDFEIEGVSYIKN